MSMNNEEENESNEHFANEMDENEEYEDNQNEDESNTNPKKIFESKFERNKKRLEQMRKLKDNINNGEESNEKNKEGCHYKEEGQRQFNVMFDKESIDEEDNNEEEEEENVFYTHTKKYFNDDLNDLSSYRSKPKTQAQVICNEDKTSLLSESLESNRDDIEVIVSDLECEVSDDNEDDVNNKKSNNSLKCLMGYVASNQKKSFIQFNNHLKTTLEASSNAHGKNTLSYIMALGDPGPEQKQNYEVESVIEEEPENITDIDIDRRRKDPSRISFFNSSTNRSNRQEELGNISTSSIQNNTESDFLRTIPKHKNSKSEFLDIVSVIQNNQIILEKRIEDEEELRILKILQMKNALVETFKRPNSINFNTNNLIHSTDPNDNNHSNQASLSSSNRHNHFPFSVDINRNGNPTHIKLPSLSSEVEIAKEEDEDDNQSSMLNDSKNSLIEVKDTNVNFEQELNLQMEKNNVPNEDIEKALNEMNILLTTSTNHHNNNSNTNNNNSNSNRKNEIAKEKRTSASWSCLKKNKKQKVKAISYEISSAIKVEILNTEPKIEKNPQKNHQKSSSKPKVMFTNNNYINNNFNNISINIIPALSMPISIKNLGISPQLTFNRSVNNSTTHTRDIRKHLLMSQGKAQSLFLNKTKFGEEFNITSPKKKSLVLNHVSTFSSASMSNHKTKKKNEIKHYLTYNSNRNDINCTTTPCLSYINFVRDHKLPLSDIMISVPNDQCKGNKTIIVEALKYITFPFSSLDHQRFAIDKLLKCKSKTYCLMIQKVAKKNNLYGFEGLYEMNTQKGILSKLYTISHYQSTINYSEVVCIYKFDTNQKIIIPLRQQDYKSFTNTIHCFTMSHHPIKQKSKRIKTV